MPTKNSNADRLGGPGSAHQDRTQPNATDQLTGHKHHIPPTGEAPIPGEPTNPDRSQVSGGGGERDRHHTHTPERS